MLHLFSIFDGILNYILLLVMALFSPNSHLLSTWNGKPSVDEEKWLETIKLLKSESSCPAQLLGCHPRSSAVPFYKFSTTGVCLVWAVNIFSGGRSPGLLTKFKEYNEWDFPQHYFLPQIFRVLPFCPWDWIACIRWLFCPSGLFSEQYAEKQCHLSCLLLVMSIQKRMLMSPLA